MAESQYTIMNEELGWDNKEEMFCDTDMSIQIEMHGNRSRDAYSFTEIDLEYGNLGKENNEELDFSDFSQKIEPSTNIQHESSLGAYRSYIIPPLSLTPSSGHYHDAAELSSMKIEPENSVQTCYIAGAEQRERTLSELCEAESIINKGTDEITNTQSVGMSIYQRETTTCMNDIEPGEGTLIRSLVSDEPSIKTESDLEDGVYGSGQTPGPDLQTIPSDVSVCSETDENTRQDDNTEPGEATLGQSFIGESLIKTEPMDSQHEFEGLMYRAKQSTACVTVLLPDNANIGLISPSVSPEKAPLMCEICGQCFSNVTTLQEHQLSCGSRNVKKLEIYSKTFSGKEDLSLNESRKTRKKLKIKMTIPEIQENTRKFVSSRNSSQGLGYKTSGSKDRRFVCSMCDKEFVQFSVLKQHLQVHTNKKPFKCEICNKSFKRESHLQTHSTLHFGNRRFKCLLCDWSFTDRSRLQRHQTIHTGEKPFKCDVCGNRYTRKDTLKRHIESTHMSNETRFKCDVCHEKFDVLKALQKHVIRHSKDNPYQCDICGKGFSDRRGITQHKLIHNNTSAAQYKCTQCKRTFLHSYHLHRHMKIHQKEQGGPYKCRLCGKGFKKLAYVSKHIKRHAKKLKS